MVKQNGPASFEDHFSRQSQLYAQHRPQYPDAIYSYLASLTPGRALAWDCGTGNGQAAIGLAQYFDRVYATDASGKQIGRATAHEKVDYHVEPAEHVSLQDASVDLVTVAVAAHWFNLDEFYRDPPADVFVQGRAFLGNMLALTGALAAAAYLLVGRWLRPTMSLMVYITTVYGVAAILLVGMALFSNNPISGFSLPVYLAFLALAVGPQLLGHTSVNYSLRYLSASFASVVLLGEPISSTILALVILNETPTTLEVVGGIIILVGIYLASRSQSAAVTQPQAAEPQQMTDRVEGVKN